jgi:hypothetical protein
MMKPLCTITIFRMKLKALDSKASLTTACLRVGSLTLEVSMRPPASNIHLSGCLAYVRQSVCTLVS